MRLLNPLVYRVDLSQFIPRVNQFVKAAVQKNSGFLNGTIFGFFSFALEEANTFTWWGNVDEKN